MLMKKKYIMTLLVIAFPFSMALAKAPYQAPKGPGYGAYHSTPNPPRTGDSPRTGRNPRTGDKVIGHVSKSRH